MNRRTLTAMSFVALLAALGIVERTLARAAQAKGTVMAPRYEVDPLWPRPLPNHWVLGQAIGLSIDEQDHVWIVHRDNLLGVNESAASQNPPTASCCVKAPPVLEFDPAGNVVGSWGGPAEGYDWPASNHGITVDYKGNVWIGANEGNDAHVLKFTKAGKFLMQIGKPGQNKGSNDTENFGRPAKIFVDAKTATRPTSPTAATNGSSSSTPTPASSSVLGRTATSPTTPTSVPTIPRFHRSSSSARPSTARSSNDGLVYVCDRPNDRIQVSVLTARS